MYKWAIDLIKESFPSCERRDDEQQRQVMLHPDYRLCVIADNGMPVGAAGYFDAPNFVYFENFCVLPEKRNCGYGSAALRLLTENLDKPFVLEAELPVDELTERRVAFYKRNGMVENPYKHIQPHYRKDDPDLPLLVLTYLRPLTASQYCYFKKYLDLNVDVKTPKITIVSLPRRQFLLQRTTISSGANLRRCFNNEKIFLYLFFIFKIVLALTIERQSVTIY